MQAWKHYTRQKRQKKNQPLSEETNILSICSIFTKLCFVQMQYQGDLKKLFSCSKILLHANPVGFVTEITNSMGLLK